MFLIFRIYKKVQNRFRDDSETGDTIQVVHNSESTGATPVS